MEQQKILNLLNEANNSKFVTRKWNIVNDDAANEIAYNTEILNLIFVITTMLTF